MKSLLFICLLNLIALTAQSQNIEGIYANKWIGNSGEGVQYTLTLQDDGNFIFDYRRIYKDDIEDSKIEVKGVWILENRLLTLKTEHDGDNKIALGLDLNKARFISVSPRNPDFNLVKPSLKFYESDVFYAKDMELIKIESTVTSN